MEAEKSHHLLPASWRPRKTGSKVQEDVSYQAIRQGEPKLPLPFGSVQALSGLDIAPPQHGGGPSAHSVHQFHANPFQKHRHRARPELMFNSDIWIPHGPVKLTQKFNRRRYVRERRDKGKL